MRYLVLSDIHANLQALEATLEAADAQHPWDVLLVLGDLVGYGGDPNAVVDRVRALAGALVIRGNHDKVAAGLMEATSFNPLARHAVEWTAAELTDTNREWLAALPEGPTLVDEGIEICHGAPFDEDAYLLGASDAGLAFATVERPLCLFGHTHLPAVFRHDQTGVYAAGSPKGDAYQVSLDEGRYLVNCGAVGQPRDGDPRAAFGLVNTDEQTVTILRVPYPVRAAQDRILAAGLPERLAQRLAVGR